MRWLDVLLVVAALPWALMAGDLGLLAALAGTGRGTGSRSASGAGLAQSLRAGGTGTLRGPVPFDIVVPAHNEELGIAATVQSLLALDYPAELRRVVVVADNCEDATAEKAREAGAHVLVRVDTERRGKGYALELAFEQSRKDGLAQAVVVVDADTLVSPNLLRVFAERLALGARALQASYGVQNPLASWRTRLMTLALALFNDLRSLGRERLGLSCGLKGNGMCFHHELLAQVPHQAYSLVEDLEYGIRLGLAGHRVWYAGDAQVKGEMVSSEKASRSQRRRWEGGRLLMAKKHALALLSRAWRERSGLLFDLGLDLLIPPLSYLVLAAFLLSVLVAALWLFHLAALPLAAGVLAFTDLCLVFYVLRGWAISGVGPRGLLDLLWAPVFVIWKLILLVSRQDHPKNAWVRTAREGESRSDGP